MAPIERVEWYQEGLDDADNPTNQGPPFKKEYNRGWTPDLPERNIAYPGDKRKANLVSSLTRTGQQAPAIDIDVPVRLVPSKTPGHGHLYIDVEMPFRDYMALLSVMVDVGIVEPNYFYAARAAGASFLRKDPKKRPSRGPKSEQDAAERLPSRDSDFEPVSRY